MAIFPIIDELSIIPLSDERDAPPPFLFASFLVMFVDLIISLVVDASIAHPLFEALFLLNIEFYISRVEFEPPLKYIAPPLIALFESNLQFLITNEEFPILNITAPEPRLQHLLTSSLRDL